MELLKDFQVIHNDITPLITVILNVVELTGVSEMKADTA